MNKLGKEAKVLLYGITITCVISFLLAFGISSLMAKEYQKDLMQHDYFVAGYLLNHSDTMTAFPQNCSPLFCHIEIRQ